MPETVEEIAPLLARAATSERAGDASAAIDDYRRALGTAPEDVGALEGLCRTLMAARRFGEAIPHLEHLIARAPQHFLPRAWLGQACTACHRLEEADAAFADALTRRPGLAGLLVEQGRVASLRGDLDRAHGLWAEAIATGLDVDAHLAVCHLLHQTGAADRALTELRAVLARHPDHARGQASLAMKAPQTMTAEEWARLEALAVAPATAPADAAALHFALVARARAAGDVEALRQHAAAANRLQAQLIPNTAAVHRQYLEDVRATFDTTYFDARSAPPTSTGEPTPIYVLGLPRSGTTLVEQILASHPDVFGGGELRLVATSLEDAGRDLGEQPGRVATHLADAAIRQRARALSAQYAEVAGGHAAITDKMPENYLHLGWIATLLGNARVVHLRRDPRDVALSLWSTRLVEIDWACDLDRIAEHIERHDALMRHWHAVLPLPILDVDYESLVADPEPEVRRILGHCGLDWHPDCLDFHRTARAVDTASADQVRQPIHRDAIGRWRRYETVLAPILERLEAVAR